MILQDFLIRSSDVYSQWIIQGLRNCQKMRLQKIFLFISYPHFDLSKNMYFLWASS